MWTLSPTIRTTSSFRYVMCLVLWNREWVVKRTIFNFFFFFPNIYTLLFRGSQVVTLINRSRIFTRHWIRNGGTPDPKGTVLIHNIYLETWKNIPSEGTGNFPTLDFVNRKLGTPSKIGTLKAHLTLTQQRTFSRESTRTRKYLKLWPSPGTLPPQCPSSPKRREGAYENQKPYQLVELNNRRLKVNRGWFEGHKDRQTIL